jgi:hypothetical protein
MTPEELAAVLTGLRVLQKEMVKHEANLHDDPVWEIMTCGGEITPLTVEEINDLCERLNTSGL